MNENMNEVVMDEVVDVVPTETTHGGGFLKVALIGGAIVGAGLLIRKLGKVIKGKIAAKRAQEVDSNDIIEEA